MKNIFKEEKFSIRKFTVGAASVVIGASLLVTTPLQSPVVKAVENIKTASLKAETANEEVSLKIVEKDGGAALEITATKDVKNVDVKVTLDGNKVTTYHIDSLKKGEKIQKELSAEQLGLVKKQLQEGKKTLPNTAVVRKNLEGSLNLDGHILKVVANYDVEVMEENPSRPSDNGNGTVAPTPTPGDNGNITPGDNGNTTPTPGDNGNTTPQPGDNGNTTPTPGDNGNVNPTPGDNGNTTPTPGDNGNTTPQPGDNGNTTPTPEDNGNTTPQPGDNGNTTPTPGDNGNTNPTPGDNDNTTPQPGDNGNTTPTPGDNGNTNVQPGDNGNTNPTPGDNGNVTPTPGDNGNTNVQPGDNGNTTPTPGDNGNTNPTPGDNGNVTPTPGDNGNTNVQPGDNGNTTPTPGDNGNITPTPGNNGNVNPQPGDNGNTTPTPGDNEKPAYEKEIGKTVVESEDKQKLTFSDNDGDTPVKVTIDKKGLENDVAHLEVEKTTIENIEEKNNDIYNIHFTTETGKERQIRQNAKVEVPVDRNVVEAYRVEKDGTNKQLLDFIKKQINNKNYVEIEVDHFSLIGLRYEEEHRDEKQDEVIIKDPILKKLINKI